jgi:acetyl esterase/lipase
MPLPLPLPALRPGRPAPDDLLARRGVAAHAAPPPPEVRWKTDEFGGVTCAAVAPEAPASAGALPPIVHLHGGGYRLGTAVGWIGFAHRLALATGRRVIVPEYRLAPEYPFPAALHDAAEAWQAVADDESEPPVLSGDSAGGGLAVALALVLRDATARLPGRLVLFSPLLDLRAEAPSYRLNAERDRLWSQSAARAAAESYLQGIPPDAEPLASPLLADPAGLPPVLLFAGTGETLIDDATAFARRAARAQLPVEAHYVADVPHDWPTLLPDHPRSAEALAAVARFLGD